MDLEPKRSQGAAIRFLYMQDAADTSVDSSSRIITSIEGIETASSMPGVTDVQLYSRVGDEAVPLKSSNDRLGHVIAVGADADEAASRADAALEAIRITYEDKR